MTEGKPAVRCAIYSRKSTEEGLEQEFNTLQAQREAAEAFIQSQRHANWRAVEDRYDDGGFTGANLDRPALQRLLADIEARRIDCVVVYKVDRLSRSLLDFAQLMSRFDKSGVSFVSVTQEFNTTTSLGRLTLHILLSFAQFEREIISERTRDKMSAARRKGKWTGGSPVLGYSVDPSGGRLVIDPEEASTVRRIFDLADRVTTLAEAVAAVNRAGLKTKEWTSKRGRCRLGRPFHKTSLRGLLGNILYTGAVAHKGAIYPGEHESIIEKQQWERINRKLDAAGARQRGRAHFDQDAPLDGVLHCACGASMAATFTVRHGRRYEYYICNADVHRTGGKETAQPRIARADIESSLREHSIDEGRGTVQHVEYDASARRVSVLLKSGTRTGYELPIPLRPGVRRHGPEGDPGRVPRISRLMALAVQFEEDLRRGHIESRAQLAHGGEVSRARISQIMALNNLAPVIQERLLSLPNTVEGRDCLTEKRLRELAREVDWSVQCKRFDSFVTAFPPVALLR